VYVYMCVCVCVCMFMCMCMCVYVNVYVYVYVYVFVCVCVCLSLVAEFPTKVLKVTGGKVEKALTDTGEDLLPENSFNREFHFTQLSKDGTTSVFEVSLRAPGPNARALQEVSGYLDYVMSSGVREVDLGIGKFVVNQKGTQMGALLKKVAKDDWNPGKQTLELELAIESHVLKETRFFDVQGNPLEVNASGYYGGGEKTTFSFSIEGEFPPEGQIKVVVYDDQKKFRLPFLLSKVDLLGRPHSG